MINPAARELYDQYIHELDDDTAELIYGAYLSALREVEWPPIAAGAAEHPCPPDGASPVAPAALDWFIDSEGLPIG